MITELTIQTEYGDSLTFSMPGSSDGYLVKEIEGLDPVPVAIVSSSVSTIDGEIYQASKREKRNIILTIKYDLNYAQTSIDERRRRLYSLFGGRQNLTLLFTTTEYGVVKIDGRMEDFDSPKFSDNPTAVISILCPDPDFVSIEEQSESGVMDDGPHIFNYEGTVPTGVIVTMGPVVTDQINGFDITFEHLPTNRITGYCMQDSPLAAPDRTWELNSIPLQKQIRNSDGLSFMRWSTMESWIWITLFPGEMRYEFGVTSGAGNDMPYIFTYHNRYGAI